MSRQSFKCCIQVNAAIRYLNVFFVFHTFNTVVGRTMTFPGERHTIAHEDERGTAESSLKDKNTKFEKVYLSNNCKTLLLCAADPLICIQILISGV